MEDCNVDIQRAVSLLLKLEIASYELTTLGSGKYSAPTDPMGAGSLILIRQMPIPQMGSGDGYCHRLSHDGHVLASHYPSFFSHCNCITIVKERLIGRRVCFAFQVSLGQSPRPAKQSADPAQGPAETGCSLNAYW